MLIPDWMRTGEDAETIDIPMWLVVAALLVAAGLGFIAGWEAR